MSEAIRPRRPPAPDGLINGIGVRLGPRQRQRLAWLCARNGPPRIWDARAALPDGVRSLIVTEAPSGPRVERLCRALAPDGVVIIPAAENPAFDLLKSKLTDFGTVGAAGADGPHELWWGGLRWRDVSPPQAGDGPLIVSGYCGCDRAADRLAGMLARLGLRFDIRALDVPIAAVPAAQVALILDAWRRSDGPVLWLDAAARVHGVPALPSATGCDFAVHKRRRCEFSPGTLYFGRSAAAEALLQTWYGLARISPDVAGNLLLDQAWSLVSSQSALDTVWLPPSYHAACAAAGEPPVIEQEIAAPTGGAMPASLEAARRASRTGAPEPHLVLVAPSGRHGPVTVMMRDIRDVPAAAVAAAVEAAADAFASHNGGFSQFELALCQWDEDIASVRRAAAGAPIVVTTPRRRLDPDSFRQVAAARDGRAPVSRWDLGLTAV